MAESGKSVKKKATPPTGKASNTDTAPAKKKRVSRKKTAKKKSVKKRVAKKTPARRASDRRPRPVSDAALSSISARERYEMIARMAYFRAEKRNFEAGWELDDWYESERLVNEMLEKLHK